MCRVRVYGGRGGDKQIYEHADNQVRHANKHILTPWMSILLYFLSSCVFLFCAFTRTLVTALFSFLLSDHLSVTSSYTYALSEPLLLTHLLFLATDKYSLLHILSPTVSLSLTGAIRTNTSDPQHTTSHGCKKRGTNRNTANNKSVVTDSRSTCKPA